MCVLCSVIRQHFVIVTGLCSVLIRMHLFLCIKVKEERIGDVVRMRMNLRKGSWCLKRMDKNMLRSSRCWEMGGWRPCVLMESSGFVTSEESSGKRCGLTRQTLFSLD
ncbi:hypothetical protein cypCar_00004077 [Cyprinus carpio]|nr:hypothetical protein cypCar_00004077 [Cyprinus carpio]